MILAHHVSLTLLLSHPQTPQFLWKPVSGLCKRANYIKASRSSLPLLSISIDLLSSCLYPQLISHILHTSSNWEILSYPQPLTFTIMDRISRFNLVHRFEKRSLLIVINCVAALSIFFFGYDQGVMGGVNTNRDYASIMGFGHWDEATQAVITDNTLLQGGIVSHRSSPRTI